jgi:pyridoxine 4-dehydrogenase
MKHNFALVDALTAIAKHKGVTPAQLFSIAWVSSLGANVVPLAGSSYVYCCAASASFFLLILHLLDRHAKRTLENVAAGGVDLTPEDITAVNDIIENHEVQGDRYFGIGDKAAHLWG